MNYKLIIIAVLMVIGGLVVLYRHWDSPDGEDEKTFFLTKKTDQKSFPCRCI